MQTILTVCGIVAYVAAAVAAPPPAVAPPWPTVEVVIPAASTRGPAPNKQKTETYKQVVYWGQNRTEKSLAAYCLADQGIDILIVSCISKYGNSTSDGELAGGWDGCWETTNNATATEKKACAAIGDDIQACQQLGKKVLVSLGGWTDMVPNQVSPNDTERLASQLWTKYGGGNASENEFRPFGAAKVDGFDFDMESNDAYNNTAYPDLISKLRQKFKSDRSKDYLITAAPQCPLPEPYLGSTVSRVRFDMLFIQFFNNPACSASQYVRPNTTLAGGGPKSAMNFDAWHDFLKNTSSRDAEVFIGLPAGPYAAGGDTIVGDDSTHYNPYFLDTKMEMPLVVNECKRHPGFRGIMLWDASNSDATVYKGRTYAQNVRSVLDTGSMWHG